MESDQASCITGAALSTRGGRTISVGRLLIGRQDRVGRVVLRINCQPAEDGHLWASLTAAEARLLAGRLLAEAAAVRSRIGPAESSD